jgi:hypothetical protein
VIVLDALEKIIRQHDRLHEQFAATFVLGQTLGVAQKPTDPTCARRLRLKSASGRQCMSSDRTDHSLKTKYSHPIRRGIFGVAECRACVV